MIRNHSINRDIPYIILAAALLALSVLVVNVIFPANAPVEFAPGNEIQPAPAISKAQQAEIARWNAMADKMKGEQQADIRQWNAIANRIIGNRIGASSWESPDALYRQSMIGELSNHLTRVQKAEAARWNAMADHYLGK
jgi:hypothetical protein